MQLYSRLFPRFFLFILALVFCLLPFSFVFAHEVYVLDGEMIAQALAAESPSPFGAFSENKYEFFFWAFMSFVVVSTIFFVSVFRLFERRSRTMLFFLKRLAHPIVRLTVGATLLIFGWYGILYGPELPLENFFGGRAGVAQILLMLLGAAALLGFRTRTVALAAMALYIYAGVIAGWYVLTYITHFGAYLLLLLLGNGEFSLGTALRTRASNASYMKHRMHAVHAYFLRLRLLAFPLMRISFGATIMFSAVYAKFWHSELALQVVHHYDLTRFFPFEPLFVVLGAIIIEFLAGLMMFLGVAVRWTALFLAFWMTLGHIFTNESWWVHIVLYGLAIAIFCHGYDRWSLEGKYLRGGGREPVL